MELDEQAHHLPAAGERVHLPTRREITGQIRPLDAIVDDITTASSITRWQ
ncbi:hypothetical protein [Streptomyces sp. NPDC002763]